MFLFKWESKPQRTAWMCKRGCVRVGWNGGWGVEGARAGGCGDAAQYEDAAAPGCCLCDDDRPPPSPSHTCCHAGCCGASQVAATRSTSQSVWVWTQGLWRRRGTSWERLRLRWVLGQGCVAERLGGCCCASLGTLAPGLTRMSEKGGCSLRTIADAGYGELLLAATLCLLVAFSNQETCTCISYTSVAPVTCVLRLSCR
jgi:hypothetical protein